MKSPILRVIFRSFLVWLAFSTGTPVFAQNFRIAVLASDMESFQSLTHQMIGGVNVAARDLGLPEPEVIWGDFRDEDEVNYAFDRLTSLGVDIVIGGLSRESATAIASPRIEEGITTVLLSSVVGRESRSQGRNIIQMGLSEAAVYRTGLERWQLSENIRAVQVLYRGEDPHSFYFGARITPYIFERYMSTKVNQFDFVDLSRFGNIAGGYYSSLQREFMYRNYLGQGGTGYIISIEDDEKLDFFTALERNNVHEQENVSVYMVDSILAHDEVSSLLEHPPTRVYLSAQFLPKLDDQDYLKFLERVGMEAYPWYKKFLGGRNVIHSNVAVKAHDAVKVATEVLKTAGPWGRRRGLSISGMGGKLEFLDEVIVTAPINTVIFDPSGSTISCFDDAVDCTP